MQGAPCTPLHLPVRSRRRRRRLPTHLLALRLRGAPVLVQHLLRDAAIAVRHGGREEEARAFALLWQPALNCCASCWLVRKCCERSELLCTCRVREPATPPPPPPPQPSLRGGPRRSCAGLRRCWMLDASQAHLTERVPAAVCCIAEHTSTRLQCGGLKSELLSLSLYECRTWSRAAAASNKCYSNLMQAARSPSLRPRQHPRPHQALGAGGFSICQPSIQASMPSASLSK